MKNLLLTFAATFVFGTQLLHAQWTNIVLPASRGGAIHSVCVKGTKLFAGKNEGIYVSEDNGIHWKKINPYLPARNYNPLLRSIAATDEYIIVAGSDMDVHISTDDGETWIKQGLETNSPRTAPIVIAANGDWIIHGHSWGPYSGGQSTDRGQNWSGFPTEMRPVVSAAIRDSIALVGTPSGLFQSLNYGLTWNRVHNISIPHFILPIAFSKNKAYTGISRYPRGNGYILSSPDDGSTWPDSSYLPCDHINSIVGSPVEAASHFIFAATDSGVFRSSDEGKSWVKKSNGLDNELVFSLAFKVLGTAGIPILFAGTGNGIFRSSDYGNNWSEIGSPAEWLFNASGSEIIAISSQTTHSGESKFQFSESEAGYKTAVYRSADNGATWDRVYSGYLANKAQITSLAKNSNNILFVAGGWYDSYFGIFQRIGSTVLTSGNGGVNWETAYSDTATFTPVLGTHLSDVYMSTTGDFYAKRISRFFDDGNSWELLNPVLTPLAPLDTIAKPPVSAFAADGNKIYLAGGNKVILAGRPPIVLQYNVIAFSMDHGQTWIRIESPLDSTTVIKDARRDTVSTITKIYPDGDHIMVGMRSDNFFDLPYTEPFSNGGGFYHLYYDGAKWIVADTAFTNQSVFGFVANRSTIFAATENGVFSTDDYGANWNDVRTGMGNIYTKELFATNSYLFASTINGLWKRPLSEITSIEEKESNELLPQKFSLGQNYPNPFNPATIIEYYVGANQESPQHVALEIYDLLGKQITKLVDKKQPAGKYQVIFKANNLASGMYIYKLKAGAFEQSRQMLLLH